MFLIDILDVINAKINFLITQYVEIKLIEVEI